MDREGEPPCPRCQRSDTTWKLTEFFGFSRDLSSCEYSRPVGLLDAPCAVSLATLEARLQPPLRPPVHNYGGCLGLALQAVWRAAFLGFILSFVLTLLLSALGIAPQSILFALATLITVAMVGPVARWLRRAEVRYQQDYPRWQKALGRWRTLYYCCRCDGVFRPGDGMPMPPEEMAAFLSESPP